MAEFAEIAADEFDRSPFRIIGREWMLIAAEKPDGSVNAMTAAWGGLGVMWGLNVSFAVIRPQRFTRGFVDSASMLTLNFLDPERYRGVQNYMGAVSGRDEDKIAKSGLSVARELAVPYFREARTVIVCRKLYAHPLGPEFFVDKTLDSQWYPQSDHHILYVSEVVKILDKAV